MDRNFDEIFQVEMPREWRRDVNRDMEAGLYTDTRIAVPALMIFAMDTDRERAKQFGPVARRDLKPLIAATERERRKEIERFQAKGRHVSVVKLRHTAHYCFVQRPDTIARLIGTFLRP